jgi:asparagine synthase (glutamine-hydrolysing)
MPQHKVMDLFSEHCKQHLNDKVLPADYWMQLADKLPEDTAELNKMLFLEMKTFLPDHNLNYTDKMSMANSVEARVPYLDVDLVELAGSMPVEMKMKGNVTKYILRK